MEDQLKRLVENAKLVARLKHRVPLNSFRRLRPSVGGYSLVSFHPDTPQKGFSGLHTELNLMRVLKQDILPPERPTPEKYLQSYLIRKGLQNNRHMEPLNQILTGAKTNPDNCLLFVTDEIRLKSDSGKHIVPDMLCVQVSSGSARLLPIELKAERLLTVTDQAFVFRELVENPRYITYFRQLAEILTDRQFKWDSELKTDALIIWPKVDNPVVARQLIDGKGMRRLVIIGYENVDTDSFKFVLEYP